MNKPFLVALHVCICTLYVFCLPGCGSKSNDDVSGEDLFSFGGGGQQDIDRLERLCDEQDETNCKDAPHCTWDKNNPCVTDCGQLTPSGLSKLFGHKNAMRKCNKAIGCAWDWNPKADKTACVAEGDLAKSGDLFTQRGNQLEFLTLARRLAE